MPWIVANENRARFLSKTQNGELSIVKDSNKKSVFNNVKEAISMSEQLATELNMSPIEQILMIC
jgi:hypothetical protein